MFPTKRSSFDSRSPSVPLPICSHRICILHHFYDVTHTYVFLDLNPYSPDPLSFRFPPIHAYNLTLSRFPSPLSPLSPTSLGFLPTLSIYILATFPHFSAISILSRSSVANPHPILNVLLKPFPSFLCLLFSPLLSFILPFLLSSPFPYWHFLVPISPLLRLPLDYALGSLFR